MTLESLNPELKNGVLLFDCPNPAHTHRIRIPVREDQAFKSNGAWWRLDGEFPSVTARNPGVGNHSFDVPGCFHLTLTKGILS